MASDPTLDETRTRVAAPLLSVRDLTVGFRGQSPAVAGVDLDLLPGQLHALVGETGAGKSLVAMALAGLLPSGSTWDATRFRLGETDLLVVDEAAWSRIRGREMGVVFQDPFTALDPLMRVGEHLAEAIRAHAGTSRSEILQKSSEALAQVGLPDADRVMRALPDELSGGMRQRVQIALALLHDPPILIADEPTASLDAEARDDILDLVVGLCKARGTSALLVSHDLKSIRSRADEVSVMVDGRVVETGPADDIFEHPRHPFTVALLQAGNLKVQQARAGGIRRPHAPRGCRYYGRCPLAEPICAHVEPRLNAMSAGHAAACHVVTGQAS